jgi:PAS domain S-box-containing protein
LRNSLLDALEGIYGVNRSGHCIFANPAALKMLGYAEHEVIGRDQHDLFHHHHADGRLYPAHDCPVFHSLIDGVSRSCEEWFWRKDGSGFPISMTVTPNVFDGHKGAVVIFHDITERKLSEAHMRHLAQHDTLTNLPNRALLTDRLHQALASAKVTTVPCVDVY